MHQKIIERDPDRSYRHITHGRKWRYEDDTFHHRTNCSQIKSGGSAKRMPQYVETFTQRSMVDFKVVSKGAHCLFSRLLNRIRRGAAGTFAITGIIDEQKPGILVRIPHHKVMPVQSQ